MKTNALFLAVLGYAARAHAGEPPPPREIVVEGDAEVKVVPDQVILTVAVDTLDKDLIIAKTQNDERVKKVLGVVKQFAIEPKHVQTNEITIEPRTRNYGEKQEFLGFGVRKQVVICLRDMTRFEPFLMALLKAGTNRVEGTQFQSTEMRKWRDEARLKAVRAAREKANAMAAELGQKVGRPRLIQENAVGGSMRTAYQNVSSNLGGDAASTDSGFAAGQISISASVTVRFDLAD